MNRVDSLWCVSVLQYVFIWLENGEQNMIDVYIYIYIYIHKHKAYEWKSQICTHERERERERERESNNFIRNELNVVIFSIICGLSQFTTKEHIARAALEAVCFQTREVRKLYTSITIRANITHISIER